MGFAAALRSAGAVAAVCLAFLGAPHDITVSEAQEVIKVHEHDEGGGGGSGATGPKHAPVSQPDARPEAPGEGGIPIGVPVTGAELEKLKRRAAEQDREAQGEGGQDQDDESGAAGDAETDR